jgi:PIN domain nuclease of toxin-antitoxin system
VKVIDTWAIIAFLRNEPGGETALQSFEGGLLSYVNLAEVLSRLARDGVELNAARDLIDRFGLTYVEPNLADVLDVGRMPSRLGFSLGDKFCIALARRFGAPLVTADRAFADAYLNIPVELIR